ncbi:MAG: regulatory signaling modulator protein AmpE [Chromatiales bacterium]|jgi:membrane protein required for beta-lactamase induction|nr:regulatory signaling modulator protein AmpE [Chromatiales bacterium]
MKLIAILLVIATEEKWKTFRSLRPFEALIEFANRMRARFGQHAWFNGPAGVLLTVAPAVVVTALIQFALDAAVGVIAWLVALVFSIVVLIACIGRRSVDEEIGAYQSAIERKDGEAAYLQMHELLPGDQPQNVIELHQRVLEMILLRNHERLLAVLFWFVVLGPLGAVFYRATTQLKTLMYSDHAFESTYVASVLRLQALLDWVPVRITALCHALVGSFADAVQQWRIAAASTIDIYDANRAVLIGSGLGSLRLQDESAVGGEDPETFSHTLAETRALVYRTVVLWVTAFAALTIVGWLS